MAFAMVCTGCPVSAQSVSWRESVAADFPDVFLNSSATTDGWAGWSGDMKSGLISPGLDLSAAERPVLFLPKGNENDVKVYISSDGVDYLLFAERKERCAIPSWTKRIKLVAADYVPSYAQVIDLKKMGADTEVTGLAYNAITGEFHGDTFIQAEVTENPLPPVTDEWILEFLGYTESTWPGSKEELEQEKEYFIDSWEFWLMEQGLYAPYTATAEYSASGLDPDTGIKTVEVDYGTVYSTELPIRLRVMFKVGDEYIAVKPYRQEEKPYEPSIHTYLIPTGATEIRVFAECDDKEGDYADWVLSELYPLRSVTELSYNNILNTDGYQLPTDPTAWYDLDSDGRME